jgi:hypothetical protein
LHWPHVWNATAGHFIKYDFASLDISDPFRQLGHGGLPCPKPAGLKPQAFTIVHLNGIHSTRIRFCACSGIANIDKVDQLLQARLFPSTVKDPKSAFTFSVLKHQSLFHLQSKSSAYDYHAVLQRLTDNTFTSDVPVSFLIVYAVKRYLIVRCIECI